jgi:beta-glucosidase
VEHGDIPKSRIDDAVRRILRAKFAVGLFDNPWGDSSLLPIVGCEAHRETARDAVRQSLVLLKNEDGLLPLDKNTTRMLIAGRGANDIGLQCGGWSIEWQGSAGEITTGKTILQGIRRIASDNTKIIISENGNMAFDEPVDVGIVVLAETPYAEGLGDLADLPLPADDLALMERVRKQCHKMVVILLSGRPRIITEQLPMMDALVAAWLPGSEGDAIAEVLFGDHPFVGKLP